MKPNPFTNKQLWAFDTETWLIQPGLLAPPLVCGSAAVQDSAWLMGRHETLKRFEEALECSDIIVGHNLAYDLGVLCATDPTLVPLVFDKLERGECFDTMVAEQLIQIHEGTLGLGHSSSGSGGFSLAELGAKYLGVDMTEDKKSPDAWRLRYAELDGVPLDQWPEAAKSYPIRDARYTYDVAARQIADGRNLHDLPAQMRAHWVLHLSAMWGIRTDKPWVQAFTAKVTAEHTKTRARFLAAGLLKVNRCTKAKGVMQAADHIDREALVEAMRAAHKAVEFNSNGVEVMKRWRALEKAFADVDAGRPMRYGTDKKALEAFVAKAYNDDPPRSGKGNIRCNKDTLWEAQDPLLEEFADAQDNEKFFSTYLKVLKQGTEVPINPRVNILVDTGRTSYSKPNLQNLPRGGAAGNPREGFVARPDRVYVSMDYPTLELRTLAAALELLGFESEMAKALRSKDAKGRPIDLHAKLGAQIKGCSYDEFMDALEAKEQWAKDFRQMSKATNFGLPGGLGPVKLVAYARQSYDARFCLLSGTATTCGVEKHFDKRSKTTVCKACLEIAYRLRDTWFETFPEMNNDDGYFALVKQWTGREVVTVEDEDGLPEDIKVGSVTQLVSERVRGRCTFTNGANTIFQGLAADVAKRALWLVMREAYTDPSSPLWGARLVVFVHDELFMEFPFATAHAGAQRACELMAQAFHEFCPTIPCAVEPAMAFRWYKDADTQRDEKGRVIPVEKCPTCKKLAPVGWNGVFRSHKTKEGVCAGVGTVCKVAEERGFGAGLADSIGIG